MKLYKALKEKKNLVGDITRLKEQIKTKNSYLEGSKNGENFDSVSTYDELLTKINELVGLKYAINVANQEIQSKIFLLGELKALIAFWKEVSVVEGAQMSGYADRVSNFSVHFTETERNEIVEKFQKQVDALQDELDEYNFATEIEWEEPENILTDEQIAEREINEKEEQKNKSE
jgi:hypothetical protein